MDEDAQRRHAHRNPWVPRRRLPLPHNICRRRLEVGVTESARGSHRKTEGFKNQNTLAGSRNHPADRYRGLIPELHLAKGARVFVNNNVRIEAGLANGALGEVVHVYSMDGDGPPSLPQCVFVKLLNYRGPQCFRQDHIIHNGVCIYLVDVNSIAPLEDQGEQPTYARIGSREARGYRSQIPVMRTTVAREAISTALSWTLGRG